MPWKEISVKNERCKFVAEVQNDKKAFSRICDDFGISRQTGYKWWKRYSQELDPMALLDRSRAPIRVRSSMSLESANKICDLRRRHPTWGPAKILVKFRRQNPRAKMPSASSVGRLLKSRNLIRSRRRRVKTPFYSKPFSNVTAPNQLWCIDFKGHFRLGDGSKVFPLTITDAFSRYLLCCEALNVPDGPSVYHVMKKVFTRYGVPEAIRSDNGAPFATMGVGGLSELRKWWIKLGIQHERIQPGKPSENGRHERMHRTLKAEACSHPSPSLQGQKIQFKKFQNYYNEERPHEALGQKTPEQFYAPSLKKFTNEDVGVSVPKFGLEYEYVDRKGFLQIDRKKVYLGTNIARELVDLHSISETIKLVTFGSVPLGILDLEKKKFTRDSGNLRRKSVSDVMKNSVSDIMT